MYRHELLSTKLKRYTQQHPDERSRRVASAIKPSFVSRDKNEEDQNTKVQTSSIIKRSNSRYGDVIHARQMARSYASPNAI